MNEAKKLNVKVLPEYLDVIVEYVDQAIENNEIKRVKLGFDLLVELYKIELEEDVK